MRDLHSASTIVIGEQSNTNLNNNNGPNNSPANVPDDDKIANSSKVEIGHMVSMVSSDSVFDSNEAADTHTQVSESANQELHETAEPEQTGNEEQPDVAAVEGESVNQEPHETEQKEVAGDEVMSEQPDVEENAARPPSSVSRKEIDECNSVSQLPKVIVKKSINAAVNRLSLHKDDEVETSGANEEQSEITPQEDQVNEPLQHEAEGEYVKGSQPEAPHEGQVTEAEVNNTNDGVVATESQKDVTTESQEVETPATQEVHVSSSTTNTAANEDSISSQEPPVVEANGGAVVEENRPEDEAVTEQEASASGGNVPENNKDDQAGCVGTAEPTEADKKNDIEEGDDNSSKTPEEIVPSGSSDESATPSDVQETQNEQQQEDNALQ